jgi:hypothetical protein
MSKQGFTEIDTHIGGSRLDLILINVIIPVVTLYARNMSYPDLENYCISLIKNYPGLTENTITKSMQKFLTPDIESLINKKAVMQQGLIHIYQNHCVNHLCNDCQTEINQLKSIVSRETNDQ